MTGATSPGSKQDEPISGRNLNLCNRRQLLSRTVRSNQDLLSRLAGLSASHALGTLDASLGENGERQRFLKKVFALDPIASRPAAGTSGTLAKHEAFELNGLAQLEYLGIGDGGVGHVDVHARSSRESQPRSGTSGNRLIVAA